MARMIEADAALACFHEWVDQYGDVHTPDEMQEYRRIEELPTVDAVPVVRCKDCLHNRACEIQYHAQAGDLFFCGAAERKDGGNG